MTKAPELARHHGSVSYFKDRKEEQRSQPYIAEESRKAAPRLKITSKAGPQFEAHLVAFLRNRGVTFETQNLAEQADVLIRDLEIQPAEFIYMALVEFVEKHEEAKILEEFNEAYGGEMEQEDREFLIQAKDYRRRKFSTR